MKAGKGTQRQAEGNTKLQPKSFRSLFFTYNNYSEAEKADILLWLKSRKNMSYIFQEETGENGTPHLQGVFKSGSSINFDTLKKKFPKVHWEVTKTWKDAVAYCSKEETRTGLIYHSDDIVLKKPLIDPLHGLELYEWQSKILTLLETEPDNRSIYWYWDDEGNIGKSSLVKHIYLKYRNSVIIANGKGTDVRNQINRHINEEGKEILVAILDISRSVENYVSYEVIEQIKNGLMYSGKYEGGICVFNPPHVIIFANFEPDYSALSADRWKVTNLSEALRA